MEAWGCTILRSELYRDSPQEKRPTSSTRVTIFRAFIFLQSSKEEKEGEAGGTCAVQQQTGEQQWGLQVLNLALLA